MEVDLYINKQLKIQGSELKVSTSRASGPGGQHVQKTDSRVTLRWNLLESSSLGEEMKARLLERLKSRLTKEGELLVHVATERSQIRNRIIARDRLALLLIKALHKEKPRKKTRPNKKAKELRLNEKKRTSDKKKLRGQKFQDSY